MTCGDSGLSGKTIILTSTHVSYFGRIASAVTGPEGTFSATTTKALTEASAWYNALGKHIDLAGGTPQGVSNNENAAQGGSNGNTQQGVSNTEQGAPSNNGGQCKSAITQLSAVYYPPYRNWKISGELTCGGYRTKWKDHNIDKQQTVLCRETWNRSDWCHRAWWTGFLCYLVD